MIQNGGMGPSSFARWFDDHYRREGESVSRAINRLSLTTGLAYGTVYWAYRGARVTPETAVELSKITEGAVPIDALVLGPTREAIRNGARKQV
jgi:hypothetical protein